MFAVERMIIAAADRWPVIKGTGGARKARVALPGGKGKSGGARVIYFLMTSHDVITFLGIYTKSKKETISDADKARMRRLKRQILDQL